MNFGVPKELPPFKQTPEYRVGLSPMGVQELMLHGATVYVETKAGDGAGFSDADYEKAGATIVFSKEEAYRRADVVLKVRRPQQEEYGFIKEGQTIMGFIHLVTAKKEFLNIVKDKKITLVGYEIMQKEELNSVLNTLAQRERKVIELRFGLGGEHPRTLEEVGETFGVTRERIRQIEAKTLAKLKAYRESQRLRDFLE